MTDPRRPQIHTRLAGPVRNISAKLGPRRPGCVSAALPRGAVSSPALPDPGAELRDGPSCSIRTCILSRVFLQLLRGMCFQPQGRYRL